MPHFLMLKTTKVVLPFTKYDPTEDEKRYIFHRVPPRGYISLDVPFNIVAVYSPDDNYPPVGCFFEQYFYSHDNGDGSFIAKCKPTILGLNRFSLRYLTQKPNVGKDIFQGVYGRSLVPKKEEIDIIRRQQVLDMSNLQQDELLKNFRYHDRVLPSLSFCIVDKLFPGTNPQENEIRQSFLKERSENRRLNMLKKILSKKIRS